METRIDWKSKLTSRKFWMAICGLVSGLLLAFKVDEGMVNEITGCIMAAASVVAYIIGEGLADAAGVQTQVVEVHPVEEKPPEDDPMEDDGR